MRIAVTSVVLFDVPEAPIEEIARDFRRANEMALKLPMETLTGVFYIMRAIERFEVERR